MSLIIGMVRFIYDFGGGGAISFVLRYCQIEIIIGYGCTCAFDEDIKLYLREILV